MATNMPSHPVDPLVEAYKSGIDRTLLTENMKRSVAERLENLASLHRSAEAIRAAGAAARKAGKLG